MPELLCPEDVKQQWNKGPAIWFPPLVRYTAKLQRYAAIGRVCICPVKAELGRLRPESRGL